MPLWRFDAIGTTWEIDSEHPLDDSVRSRINDLIEDFDRTWSRFRRDSLVSRLGRSGGTAALPPDAPAMLDAYRALTRATDGAVNPLVAESLNALGYDPDYSLRPGTPRPAPSEWTGIVSWAEPLLSVSTPALLDVGALGKGRLVDRVFDELADVPGIRAVDAGGDLRVREDMRVGLEHPFDPSAAIGVAMIRDQAICASAITRRAWGSGLHHVLDARTGIPVRTWAATWAIGADAMTADAVATALFFDGGADFAAERGVEWVRMSTDGRAQWSASAPIEVFRPGGRSDEGELTL